MGVRASGEALGEESVGPVRRNLGRRSQDTGLNSDGAVDVAGPPPVAGLDAAFHGGDSGCGNVGVVQPPAERLDGSDADALDHPDVDEQLPQIEDGNAMFRPIQFRAICRLHEESSVVAGTIGGVSNEIEGPGPEADPIVGDGLDDVGDSDKGAIVHLNEIVEQANKDKRSIDQLLQDKRPWAQVNPSREMQESISGLLSSIRAQNSEIISALNPMGMEGMRAAVGALNDQMQVSLGRIELGAMLGPFAAAQSEVLSKAFSTAFGAISEANRGLSTLESLRNRPGFATSTQRFLASTEDLRYGAGKIVWHYTSGYVLMQVLSKHHLWASIPHNLNDSSEVTHGLEIVRNAFDKALRQLEAEPNVDVRTRSNVREAVEKVLDPQFFDEVMNEIYIVSASGDSDSLTLWRNYSGGDGFAIGISTSATLSPDGITETPEAKQAEAKDGVPPIGGWYKVHYLDSKKKELAEKFVANAIVDIKRAGASNRSKLVKEQRKHILILASTMKHKAFKDEKEVRWMTTNWMPAEVMPHGSVIHYEHTLRGIVPVLHLQAASSEEGAVLPIRGIRCSPASPEGIRRTIKGLLVQRGYADASRNVERSEQPYRG